MSHNSLMRYRCLILSVPRCLKTTIPMSTIHLVRQTQHHLSLFRLPIWKTLQPLVNMVHSVRQTRHRLSLFRLVVGEYGPFGSPDPTPSQLVQIGRMEDDAMVGTSAASDPVVTPEMFPNIQIKTPLEKVRIYK